MKVPPGVSIDRDPTISSLEDIINQKLTELVGDQKEELPPDVAIKHISPEEALQELLALENGANITQNLTADNL